MFITLFSRLGDVKCSVLKHDCGLVSSLQKQTTSPQTWDLHGFFIPLMQNPWRQLPVKAPFVLPMDAAAVAAYQQHFAGSPNLQLQTQLMPEPYHGNPNASICILSLNPGFSEHDTHWHFDTELGASLRANLAHESAEYPFVYFDPRFEDSPGAKWWRRKTRRVIEHVGLSKAASAIFNV